MVKSEGFCNVWSNNKLANEFLRKWVLLMPSQAVFRDTGEGNKLKKHLERIKYCLRITALLKEQEQLLVYLTNMPRISYFPRLESISLCLRVRKKTKLSVIV